MFSVFTTLLAPAPSPAATTVTLAPATLDNSASAMTSPDEEFDETPLDWESKGSCRGSMCVVA
jgi:hypothetical protein